MQNKYQGNCPKCNMDKTCLSISKSKPIKKTLDRECNLCDTRFKLQLVSKKKKEYVSENFWDSCLKINHYKEKK